ncbi:MAG: hypothetical protein HKO99_09550 [Xanthomonadales bacterium]|nr:hypothetical protein [Gammaproteobacteria bacterium]NNK51826.1 hypothetical protein [Xanthomonadales bacterium]
MLSQGSGSITRCPAFKWRFALCASLLLSVVLNSEAASLSVEFELVARSGVTTVPAGIDTFSGFGNSPAIDSQGNVVFTGGGGGLAGIYTAIGECCQVVADTTMMAPEGGGATFFDFSGAQRPDIDQGRVAFEAWDSNYVTNYYSNAGQPTSSTLALVASLDDTPWVLGGDPWVDGDYVALYGQQSSYEYEILEWHGPSRSQAPLFAGDDYSVAYESQAARHDGASILSRFSSSSYEMSIILPDGQSEILAISGVTPMPGLPGFVFDTFYSFPVIDRCGQDAAFLAYSNQVQGLFKRADSGILEGVANTTVEMPSSGGDVFRIFNQSALSLANGQVAFQAKGQYFREGIYTDVGGELSVVLDNQNFDSIELDGQNERVLSFAIGPKAMAHTPNGFQLVFYASLASGGTAIIKATLDGASASSDIIFSHSFED